LTTSGGRAHDCLLVRVLTVSLSAVLAAFALAASGGSRPSYPARSLPAIFDAKPKLAGWSLEQGDPYMFPIPAHAPAFTLKEFVGESPARRAIGDRLRKAGFVIGRHKRWGAENKKLNASADVVFFAFLFHAAPGARTAYRFFIPPKSSWEPGTKALPLPKLGDESSGLYEPSGSNGNESAVFLWRRANLVILAEIVCDTECGFDVVRPASAYVSWLDARAREKA
jgi:hypothetical protein